MTIWAARYPSNGMPSTSFLLKSDTPCVSNFTQTNVRTRSDFYQNDATPASGLAIQIILLYLKIEIQFADNAHMANGKQHKFHAPLSTLVV